MIDQLKPLIGNLSSFSQKRLGFERPPKLFLRKDSTNSQQILGKTAFYDPDKESITLFIHGRHPKDILRSFAHELVHHSQNLRGDLSIDKMGEMNSNYAQDNPHMRNMEKEAYLKGNMCFRDWEDTIKDKNLLLIKLAESKFLKENKTMTKKITKEFLKESIQKILLEKIEEQELEIGPGLPDTMEPDLEVGPDAEGPGMAPDLEIRKAIDAQLDKGLSMEEIASIIQDILDEPVATQVDESNCGKREDECLDENCPTHGKTINEEEEDLEEAAKMPDKNRDGIPDYAQDGKGANDLGKAKDTDSEEKDDDDKKEESDKDMSKVPPQLRKHVAGKKKNESMVQTPEQENRLYEERFAPRNNRLFEKLLKEWTK